MGSMGSMGQSAYGAPQGSMGGSMGGGGGYGYGGGANGDEEDYENEPPLLEGQHCAFVTLLPWSTPDPPAC